MTKKMEITPEHNERMAKMTFASVYPHYVTKIEKKGRTKEELHQVIEWLTGFDDKSIQELIDEKATFETFFNIAKLNTNADLIKGVICGYRIEKIGNYPVGFAKLIIEFKALNVKVFDFILKCTRKSGKTSKLR